MVRVILSDAAKSTLAEIIRLGLPDSTAIVITTEAKTDTLVARFIDLQVLDTLKTHYLGEVVPGIALHVFGLDDFPRNAEIELSFFTVRPSSRTQIALREVNMSYFMRVVVRKIHQSIEPAAAKAV